MSCVGDQQPDRGAGLGKGRVARGEITKIVLGLTGGVAVNDLSSEHGWRILTVVVVVAAVLLAADWLRRLPPGAPLVTFLSRAALGAAGLSAVAAVAAPARWQGYAAAAATMFAVGALTIRSYPGEASNALAGAALIGAGVGFLAEGEAPLGATLLAAGLAGVGFGDGVDFLVEAEALLGLTVVGLGVVGVALGAAGVGVGVASLVDGEALLGMAVIGGGVAVIGVGEALMVEGQVRSSVARVGLGVVLIGAGVASMVEGQALSGVALIGLGVAVGGLGGLGLRGSGLTTWFHHLVRGSSGATHLSNECER